MNRFTISVANDFSPYPAGRYLKDGEYNGTTFRQDILVPALKKYDYVEVVFDGVAGFGSSFLDEAFGGLVRNEGMSKEFLDSRLHLSASEPELQPFVKLAERYIEGASKDAP